MILRTSKGQGSIISLYLALLLLNACGSGSWQGGIHARLGWSETQGLRVVDVPRRGPSYEAGLRNDDRIMAVNGQSVEGMTLQEVVKKLRGPVGSYVTLQIQRGEKALTVELQRAPYTGR